MYPLKQGLKRDVQEIVRLVNDRSLPMYPLKQGLKLRILSHYTYISPLSLPMYPLKQGLKPHPSGKGDITAGSLYPCIH